MKKLNFGLFLGLFVIATSSISQLNPNTALAYSPSLSISSQYGSSATLTITGGAPNSSFQLYYTLPGSSLPSVVSNGSWVTDYNGYYSTAINSSDYGIMSGSTAYAKFYNGDQTNQVNINTGGGGCSYYGCNIGGLTLNPSSLNLNVGQSAAVSISSGVYMYAYSPYISSNSNPSVASASVSNYQLMVYGNSSGSTTITVCLSGGSTCGSLYVTVGGGSNVGGITFSENNPNLSVGQSKQITVYQSIYYTYQNYYISSNSNSSVVSANISGGNMINLYGLTSGSSTLTVCQTNSGACGSLYVTVSGSGSYSNITFSPSSVSVNAGQSANVTVYGGSSNYISSNSNSSAATASLSGSTLYVYGQQVGSTTITVCPTNYTYSNCGYLYVTVTGSSSGSITFSDANPALNTTQTKSVNIYSNLSGSFYISNNSTSGIADAYIYGSTISVYGRTSGSTTITVCQYSNSQCGYLYVTVYGYGGNYYLSPSNVTVNVGQTATVTANFGSTYSGNLYLSSNSNPNVASASFSGSTIYVYGTSAGSTTMSICYSNQCNNLYVTVSGGSSGGALYFTTTSLPQPTVGQYYSQQLQVSGGSTPYYFSLLSGSLPNGLSLSTSGQIFGTPQNTNPASFTLRVTDNYGRTGTANLTLTPVGSSVLGAAYYNNGFLLLENNTVYIVYKNTRTGFANRSAFEGLGFNFNQVSYGSSSGLVDSGYIVNTSRASHPWGSWVKSGQTVYFVHESGLIPVPSYDIFQNNGGQDNLVVKANTYDFQRPILSMMVYNDARLR